MGLTQAGLAEQLGVAPNSVARWERNEMRITEPVARFARLLAAQAPKSKGKQRGR
jgi:transcriptional regulator with XRE-family HTH domain